MSVRYLKVLILFSIVFSSLSFAAQGPQSFTLDGILKQAGTNNPLLDPAVTITVQIMDPTKQCLLYEEQQTVSTSTSKGYFNIVVGSDLGSPKRTGNDPGLATYQIYQNSGAVIASNVPGQTCAGGLFTPVTQDYRYMRIIVTPSSTGVADTLSPDTLMDAVPAAVVAEWAESVGGFTPNDLLKVNVSGGMNLSQVNLESLFTPAAWPNLQAVAAGNFMNKTANNGASLPTYTTGAPPAAPAEGSIWFDSDTNQIKYYDGAATQIVGTSGMGVTSVDTTTNFTVDGVAGGTITSTGEIDLSNTGVVAGTYPKVQVDAKGRVLAGTATLLETDLPSVIDDPGRVSGDAITSGTIGGSTSIATTGTVSAASASFRQIDLYDSDNTNYVRFVTPATGVLTSNYTLTFPANAGTGGQALTTDGSGGLAWTTIVTDVGNTADLADGMVWIGDGAGTAQERAISGDIAITNAGVATIQADTVTYAKIQNVTDNRLLGRSAGSAGDVQEIQVGTGLTMAAGTIALTDTTDDDTLGGLSCANNEVPRWNGAAWVCQLANTANSNNTLVLRDGSGNFAANNITAAQVSATNVVVDNAGNSVTLISGATAPYSLTLPVDDGGAGQVLSTDGSGVLSWINALTSATGYVNGGNSFGADATIGLNDNFRLDIETSNTPRITVSGGGNIGIGTTNPASNLDIRPSANGDVLRVLNTSGGVGAKFSVSGGGHGRLQIRDSGGTFDRLDFDGSVGDLLLKDTAGTTFVNIDSAGGSSYINGNVGIGVTDPDVKLEIAGTVRVGDGGETCSGGNFTGGIRYNGGNLQFCNGASWQTLGLAGSGITSLTGDVTATGPGAAAATIANDAVTSTKILDGTIATGDLANDAVTYAKIQNVTDNRLLGRSAGSDGDAQEIQIGTGLTMAAGTIALTDTTDDDTLGGLSCAANEVPKWNGAAWVCQLAASANGNGTLVLRDGTGNFSSNNITANGFTLNNAGSLLNISSPVGANYNLVMPAAVGSTNQVLTAVDGAGTLGWSTPLTSSTGYLNGGNTFGADASIGLNDNFRLDVKTNNAVRMTIAADGDVGIGTTNPSAIFEVAGGDALIHTLTVGSGGGGNQKNTAFGLSALASNTTGENNTAIGREALMSNTTNSYITAIGQGALRASNGGTTGSVAVGSGALYNNTTGHGSVAVGTFALITSTTGTQNTGIGHRAMQSATTGSSNTSVGYQALQGVTTGDGNTTLGHFSGANISTGSNNLILGRVNAVSATANDQLNIGNLIFGSGVGIGTTLSTGNVGIGVTDADVKLEVAGTLRVGDGGETCSGGNFTGGIRYNGGNLQFCDGTAWNTLGLAGSGITSLTGDVTATGPGAAAATIANDAVTFAKMQNINTQRLLGRGTAAVGDVEEISLGAGLTLTGTTLDVTDGTDDDALGALSCAANEVPKWNGSAWVCQLAESANGNSSLVLRDGTGNFASNNITANAFTLNNAGSLVSMSSPIGANYSLIMPAAVGSANQVLTAIDGAGTLGWSTALTSGTGYVNGGNSFGADATIGLNDNFRLDVKTNNATRMTVAAGGNVGIGTTNPLGPLHVIGDNGFGYTSVYQTAPGANGVGIGVHGLGVNKGLIQGGTAAMAPADLLINPSGGNVGIGGTNPNYLLDVMGTNFPRIRASTSTTGVTNGAQILVNRGDVADGYAAMIFTTAGTEDWQIGTREDNSNLYFRSTDTNDRMVITSTGSVGMGITNPASPLHLHSATDDALAMRISYPSINPGNWTGLGIGQDVRPKSAILFEKDATLGNGRGHLHFAVDNTADSSSANLADAKMTIHRGGNVGIGTTNPGALLHVNGPMRVQPSALPGTPTAGDIAIDSGASNALKYYDGSSWVSVGGGGGGDFFKDGSVAMTGSFKAADGTAAAPSITFDTSTGTGLFKNSTGIGFATSGTHRMNLFGTIFGSATNFGPTMHLIATTASQPQYSFNSDTDTGMFRPDPDVLAFSTNATERVRIAADGKVGIGTTSPTYPLTVNGQSQFNGAIWAQSGFWSFYNGNSATYTSTSSSLGLPDNVMISIKDGSFGAGVFSGFSFGGGNSNGYIGAVNSGSNAADVVIGAQNGATSYAERLRITSAGYVGIGTTSPARLLHVNGPMRVQPAALPGTPAAGDIAIDSGDSNKLKFYNGSVWVDVSGSGGSGLPAADGTAAAPSIAFSADTDTGIYRSGNNSIDFATGGAQRMRITNNAVGINSTATNYALEVQARNSSTATARFKGSDWDDSIVVIEGGSPSAGRTALLFTTDMVQQFQFVSDPATGFFFLDPGSNINSISPNAMRFSSAGNFGFGVDPVAGRRLTSSGPLRVTPTAAPASPAAGDIYFDSGDGNKLKYHNGTGWVTLVAGAAGDFMADGSVAMTGTFKAVDGTTALPGITFASDTGNGIALPSTDTLTISTNGSERIRVTSSGHVGIGGVDPAAFPLWVRKNQNASSTFYFNNANSGASASARVIAAGDAANTSLIQYSSTSPSVGISGPNAGVLSGGGPALSVSSAGILKFFTNGVTDADERMRIDASGNTGIGTTAPGVATTAGRTYLTLKGSTGAGALELATSEADAAGNITGILQWTDVNSVAADKRVGQIQTLLSGATANNRGGNLRFMTKANGASGLTTKMTIEENGNVGIGELSPARLLHVGGPMRVQPAALPGTPAAGDIAIDSGASNALKYYDGSSWVSLAGGGGVAGANTQIQFNSGGSFSADADFVWDSTNNRLGIGVASPTRSLEIYNSADAAISLRRGTNANSAAVTFVPNGVASGSNPIWTTGILDFGSTAGYQISSWNGSADYTALQILPNGNVGIGTTNPTARLAVAGDNGAGYTAGFSTAASGAASVVLGVTNSKGQIQGFTGGSVYGDLLLNPGGGNIGIGTTNPISHLHVTGGIRTDAAFSVTNFGTIGGSAGGLSIRATAGNPIRFQDAGVTTDFMTIMSSGNVGIGTTNPGEKLEVSGNVKATSFISTSDARLKRDIASVDAEGILQLSGVKWNWKSDGKEEMGVIAQEVEKVYPWAVVTDPSTGYKSVKYNALIAPLIESTKNLYGICEGNAEQIAALDREIASLKSKVERLSNENEMMKAYLCQKDPSAPFCN